jgi:hypothetical protein
MGARQRERAKARNRPARVNKETVGGWKHGVVWVSTFQAFFRVIAFSRLPVMVCEHGAAPRRRGGAGSATGARQRERAKARKREIDQPAETRKPSGDGSTVSSGYQHFRPSFALSRFRDWLRCSGNVAQRRDGESALVRQRERDSAKARNRPARGNKETVGGWKHGFVWVSTFQAFFRVIAF